MSQGKSGGIPRGSTAMSSEQPAAGLSPRQGAALEHLIRVERERTAGRVAGLTRELGVIVESSAIGATDDEHDPEGSTIAFERAQISALLTAARNQLADLERAAERLRAGSYGICTSCGDRIVLDRLMARPTAQTCMSCAAARRYRPS